MPMLVALLNSGNVVFHAASGTAAKHATAITAAIATRLKVQVPVVAPEQFALGKDAAYLLCARGILESNAAVLRRDKHGLVYGVGVMSALIQQIAAEFSIPVSTLLERCRIACGEAEELVVAEVSESGRQHLLVPAAADAWQEMQRAARQDQVSIFIVSGFRSVERQAQIVRRKLEIGIPIERVLALSALPGYSEHHTGRAVDVGSPGGAPLEYEFHDTAAFVWLESHAVAFQFHLSYPPGNPEGFEYEP